MNLPRVVIHGVNIGLTVAEIFSDGNFGKLISASHFIYSTAGTMYYASQGKIVDTLASLFGIVNSLYHLSE